MPRVKKIESTNESTKCKVKTNPKKETSTKSGAKLKLEELESPLLATKARTRAVSKAKTASSKVGQKKKAVSKSNPKSHSKSKENTKQNKKRTIKAIDENYSEDNAKFESQSPKKKRKVTIPDDVSEDSFDEYKPDSTDSEEEDSEASLFKAGELTESESDYESLKKMRKLNTGKAKEKVTKSKPKNKDAYEIAKTEIAVNPQSWPHLKYEFLQPDKIKDNQKRSLSHPDYNPKTLYIPIEFLDAQTPAMRQWWVLKSEHFDCILLFKVWKFYKLYHMDAIIGAKELNLSYLKDTFAHVGFMEIAFGQKYASLIEKGYKVARIEQTETPEMASQRCAKMSKATKFDKVVRREVCQISTKGSRVFNFLDTVEASSPNSVYLLSIVEKNIIRDDVLAYGVCFIDTSIGEFYLGQFQDDQCNSKLLTLIAHFPPAHIVYERGNLSSNTLKLLNYFLPDIFKEALSKEIQFWTATKVLQCLYENEYFINKDSTFSWPDGLKSYLKEVKNGQKTIFFPIDDKELAIAALGGCVSTLKEYLLDQHLLSQGIFKTYSPPSFDVTTNKTKFSHNMILDAMTLNNLKILGTEGSLIKILDHCCTPFGQRLFREWICRPSCRKCVISERQLAISDLLDAPDIIQQVRGKLFHLPDLERLISKIHAQGTAAKLNEHPDRRAIFCEKNRYTKRTINDFITALNSFEEVLKIVEIFSAFENPLIKKCVKVMPEGNFPQLQEILNQFKKAFNQNEAKKEGFITLQAGIDKEYDNVMLEFEEIKKESNEYLKKLEKKFGVPLKFVGSDCKRYQIEIPDNKKVGDEFELIGSRKGFKRYYTEKSKQFYQRQGEIEERNEAILKNINRIIFSKFSDHYEKWSAAAHHIAVIDCLISLAEYAKSHKTCIPKIYDDTDKKKIFIKIEDGVHPCISCDNFIPNDTLIGGDKTAPLMILSGPNMGGKSTLMRQVGLITIMAQVGSYVPASTCELTLIDRIFTRLGASDDIVAGQSTFLVELKETATILQHATKYSLILLDELGRGTSTYDGTAIAASVIEALTKINCRTLFSTHYHTLIENFKTNRNIMFAHMAYKAENKHESPLNEENVTFLYKLVEGACPKSYGFNAARLAGVPPNIIKRARVIAKKLEAEVSLRHAFTTLCCVEKKSIKSSIKKIRTILASI
ncbi:probable DNA mismatch repair protein Msh6 isoform X3 [Phymastichus coffea]|uniref:probable DNA mismatch repair protein Msh6 isoform X3 n=1 Tax=Phymastichus coffea TaxID=108790 RepID=UPI00273BB467|nr:probable DNA mismatch repair protein Msh6 isoform X3 [Phymastichus coffea]